MPPTHHAADGPRTALALLAVAAVAWGVNWSLMKRILTELPPWTYPALATMAGGSVLMLIARLAGQPLAVSRRDRAPLAAIAFANFTVWPALASWGVSMLPAGRAAILNFTMPVFSIVLGYLVLGERLTRARALALGLGMSGILLLLAGDARAIAAAPLGVVLMLAAALTWAVSIVLMKRHPVTLPAIVFTAWQLLLGGAPIVVVAVAVEAPAWRMPSAGALAALALSVGTAWTLAYWAWTRAVLALPLAVVSLGALAIPVIGVAGGVLLLGERPPASDWAALALLVMALFALAGERSGGRAQG